MNTFWQGRTVLVTGADGFIGSHLTDALVEAGADVTALAYYNSFDSYGWLNSTGSGALGSPRLVRGDVREPDQMRELAREKEFVFHLAALIAIPFSYEAPSSYVQTNIQGTLNVLNAALEAGVSRVVHTSTSEVYGTALWTPITEDHPLQTQSPYSASKAGADHLAEAFYRSFHIPVVTLRPFNTFGPRQSERAVISSIIRQLLDDACVEVHVGSLTPRRDFNFVSDIVEAFLALAEADGSVCGKVFNAGSGASISIEDLLKRIGRITGIDKPVVQEPERMRPIDSEVFDLVASAERLKQAAGWVSRVTLDEGLERTVRWWRSRLGAARLPQHFIK